VTGDEPTYHESLGFLMVYGGVGMSIPGIILWKKGSRKYRRSLEREGLQAGIGANGLSLAYGF
jgi:hypothetical protein